MRYERYREKALRVAYCHRVVLHAQTYRRLPQPLLDGLPREGIATQLEPYGIRLLDLGSDDTDLVCQLSLQPAESVAVAASKFKGRLSKWLRSLQQLDAPAKLLAKGYLAYTVGDTTNATVANYLEKQGRHHGYTERPLPPVLVETCPADSAARLEAAHSVSLLRYHLVFGTARRKGVFTQTEATRILAAWRRLETERQFALLKASFVPDHVHLAVRVHPAVKPLALGTELMNLSQDIMFREFPEIMIRYGANQLWENGAYIGSIGDVASRAVQRAIRRWRNTGTPVPPTLVEDRKPASS
jgi:REP element-mobilizing transposase RayT